MTPLERSEADTGSTVPLILGFFVIALMVIAGGVAAGDAYVAQRDLQHICDAAAAAAASDLDLDRSTTFAGTYARFESSAAVERAVTSFLASDPTRGSVTVTVTRAGSGDLLSLHCTRRTAVTFGALFGKSGGVQHSVTSAVRSALAR